MVSDIQLRLLDVGFPTSNITYCTTVYRVPDVMFFPPTRLVPDI